MPASNNYSLWICPLLLLFFCNIESYFITLCRSLRLFLVSFEGGSDSKRFCLGIINFVVGGLWFGFCEECCFLILFSLYIVWRSWRADWIRKMLKRLQGKLGCSGRDYGDDYFYCWINNSDCFVTLLRMKAVNRNTMCMYFDFSGSCQKPTEEKAIYFLLLFRSRNILSCSKRFQTTTLPLKKVLRLFLALSLKIRPWLYIDEWSYRY